jgi:hypothetical protein
MLRTEMFLTFYFTTGVSLRVHVSLEPKSLKINAIRSFETSEKNLTKLQNPTYQKIWIGIDFCYNVYEK